MEENQKSMKTTETNKNDCGCDGGCCPPKKKSLWPKVIFTMVILAAAWIIVARLFFASPQAPAANKAAVNDPNSPSLSDTSCSKPGCDTTKGKSCCPK